MADEIEISKLSNQELLCELRSQGLRTGPITPTTRKVLEKRLAKARGVKEPEVEICTSSVEKVENSIKLIRSESQEPSLFYGVCYDVESPNLSAVFTDKSEALIAARKVKGSRFKPFPTRREAEEFPRSFLKENSVHLSGVLESSPKPVDPVSNFKTPKPQELTRFRHLIEQDKHDDVLDAIRNNPKYLVASGDTPVILQEGYRYNALHVAAKGNRKEMCCLIINTLESDWFWQNFLQQKDNSANYSDRKQFLVDMYLNTPDKGFCDTPLHFACKFGHIDIVEFLVAHPLTDLNSTNKFGETPEQVICSRCRKDASGVKEKIRKLLQDNYFVPVFGSEDNMNPPRIGDPWSPDMSNGDLKKQKNHFLTTPKQGSPVLPGVTIRAYAGPMSPVEATDFHRVWKTPPLKSDERRKDTQIRRGDQDRGLERIGRQLARDRRIRWAEYWKFLGCFTDLATPEGLKKLEQFLADKRRLESSCSLMYQTSNDGPDIALPKTPDSRRTDVIVANDVSCFECSQPDVVSCTHTVVNSPPFMNDVEHSVHTDIQQDIPNSPEEVINEEMLSDDLLQQNSSVLGSPGSICKKNLFQDFSDGRRQHQQINEKKEGVSDSKMSADRSQFPAKDITELQREHFGQPTQLESRETRSFSDGEMLCQSDASPFRKAVAAQSSSTTLTRESCHPHQTHQHNTQKRVGSEEDTNTRQRRPGDQRTEKTSDTDIELMTEHLTNLSVTDNSSCGVPPYSPRIFSKIFIQGSQPTKSDLDVLMAIGNVAVDPEKYPCVACWKNLVTSYSNMTRLSWPSPGSPRLRKQHSRWTTKSC